MMKERRRMTLKKINRFKNDKKLLDVLHNGNVVCSDGIDLSALIKILTVFSDIISQPKKNQESYYKFYSEKILDSKLLKQFDSIWRLTNAGYDLQAIYKCLVIEYLNKCINIRNKKIEN